MADNEFENVKEEAETVAEALSDGNSEAEELVEADNETSADNEKPAVDWYTRGIIGKVVHAQRKNNSGRSETVVYYVREVCSWVFIFLLAFVIAVMFNMYAVRFSNVVGDSMLVTYHNGDRVTLSKLPYIFGEPERGDVVVFDSTGEVRSFGEEFKESCKFNLITQHFMDEEEIASITGKYYIKRIIGIEGDVIEIRDNVLYVNGQALQENYVNPNEEPDYSFWEGRSWTVGEDEIFVMGDNRNNSHDSRNIGVLPEGCILGKVVG